LWSIDGDESSVYVNKARERISDRSCHPSRVPKEKASVIGRLDVQGKKIFLAAPGDYNYSSTAGECISYEGKKKTSAALQPTPEIITRFLQVRDSAHEPLLVHLPV
jgi:hypothetical protein